MLEDTIGEAMMLLEAGPDEEDVGATKFACCNKDTS